MVDRAGYTRPGAKLADLHAHGALLFVEASHAGRVCRGVGLHAVPHCAGWIGRDTAKSIDLVTHGHDLPLGRDPVSVGAYAVPCGHGLGFALDSWTATVVKWGCSIAAQISVLTTCATSTQADLAVRTAAI
jgi:hypothetical protein